MSKKSGTGKFVFGAALGALAGLFLAPKAGKESRKEVVSKANELLDKAKEIDVKEVREQIEEKVNDLIKEIKSLDGEKVEKIAKEKASNLKKQAEDLVKFTKDKATPKVEEAAGALKEKAIEVTKKVLDKLEEETK